MSDILQEAEALIEKHTTSGYIHRDATLLLPGLVEEIKHLRVLECAAKANMTRRDEDIGDLMKELAKWQQIAIDERARAYWLYEQIDSNIFWDMWDKQEKSSYEKEAAEELGLQVKQEAGYVERLERLALSLCMEAGWDQEDFEAALEKIRRG
jgi:hypothetical protein